MNLNSTVLLCAGIFFLSGMIVLTSLKQSIPVQQDNIIIPQPVIKDDLIVEEEFTVNPRDVECLALNIYHEARSDSFAGKLAVADVTINRVESNLFPNNICNVVYQTVMRINWKGEEVPARNKCQFSWYCDGKSDEPREALPWAESQSIANIFLTSEKFRGITEGATHYHTHHVSPDWKDDRGMQFVGTIGEHLFYRWH